MREDVCDYCGERESECICPFDEDGNFPGYDEDGNFPGYDEDGNFSGYDEE